MPAIKRHVFFFGGRPASWRKVFAPSAADDDMRTGSIADMEEGVAVGASDARAAVAGVEGVQEARAVDTLGAGEVDMQKGVITSVPDKDVTPPNSPLVVPATCDVNAVACDSGNQSFGRPHSAGVSSMMSSSSSSSGLSTQGRFT